jgi:hypothetical protein
MYLSVSGIDFATVSMIIRMDFGIVATVNFFFSFYFINNIVYIMN